MPRDPAKRLIINADDFGWSKEVNEGIIDCYLNGILTSTTVLVNGPAFQNAARCAVKHPGLGVGWHMNILRGKPIADITRVPSLVTKNGGFSMNPHHLLYGLLSGRIERSHIEIELEAQLKVFKEHFGQPTHMDSEKHFHVFPRFREAAISVALRHHIRFLRCPLERISPHTCWKVQSLKACIIGNSARTLRRKLREKRLLTSDAFYGLAATGRMTSQQLIRYLTQLQGGVTEIMSHPGFTEPEHGKSFGSSYLEKQRRIEHDALVDPAVQNKCEELGIERIHFGQL